MTSEPLPGDGGESKELIAQLDKEFGRKKAPPLTPQSTYESFLLHVLATRFDGRGGKHEVTEAVIELMKSRGFVGDADLKRVQTGETKAENTIAWGRNALKDRNLISRLSPRGVWELTAEGTARAKQIILPRQPSSM